MNTILFRLNLYICIKLYSVVPLAVKATGTPLDVSVLV